MGETPLDCGQARLAQDRINKKKTNSVAILAQAILAQAMLAEDIPGLLCWFAVLSDD